MKATKAAVLGAAGLADRPAERLLRLYLGLVIFGSGLGLMVRAELGLGPWDVLHQGLSRQTGLSLGLVIIAVSLVVLLAWIPLRQRPGIGTVSNVVVVGLVVDQVLALVDSPPSLVLRWAFLASSIVLTGVATGLYVGARLGPGARDGLMTGLAQRGMSIRLARTLVELTVLVIGLLLGGTAGVGTVLFAISIGPVSHFFMPRLDLPDRTRDQVADQTGASS